MRSSYDIALLKELYSVKQKAESIVTELGGNYCSREHMGLISDAIVVLACISESDDAIQYEDRMVIELLFPVLVENNNRDLYKQVRGNMTPEQLKLFSAQIITIAGERNNEKALIDSIDFFESLGSLYFKINPSRADRQIYFREFLDALKQIKFHSN